MATVTTTSTAPPNAGRHRSNLAKSWPDPFQNVLNICPDLEPTLAKPCLKPWANPAQTVPKTCPNPGLSKPWPDPREALARPSPRNPGQTFQNRCQTVDSTYSLSLSLSLPLSLSTSLTLSLSLYLSRSMSLPLCVLGSGTSVDVTFFVLLFDQIIN